MSKIIEATNKLINGDKEALVLIDKIVEDLSVNDNDFEDINCVGTHKEFILGYVVYYGLSKMKVALKDGETVKYQLVIHGIFRPLDGVRMTDQDTMNLIQDEIAARNQ